jgi:ComF family protein
LKSLSYAWQYLATAVYDLILPGICVTCGGKAGRISGYICKKCYDLIQLHGGRKVLLEKRQNLGILLYLFPYEPWLGVDMGNAVRALKYSGYQGIAKEIAELLCEVLLKFPIYLEADIITEIPLHPARQRERGFNQSAMLAENLAHLINLPYRSLLNRGKNTRQQAELSMWERELNVKGAFNILPINNLKGKTIILVDDQATTGATLDNAAGVLLKAGAEQVLGLSVTH